MASHRGGGGTASTASTDDVRLRYEAALSAGRMGTFIWHLDSGVIDWDGPMEDLFGVPQGSFGGTWADFRSGVHPDDLPAVEAQGTAIVEGRARVLLQDYRVLVDGGVRWLRAHGVLQADAAGGARLVGVAVDVTAERVATAALEQALAAERRVREEALAGQRRLEVLAEAAALLDSPLHLDGTLQQVADLAAGTLADWCVVELFGAAGPARHVAVSAADPRLASLGAELVRRYPVPLHQLAGYRADRLAPLHLADIPDELLDAVAPDPEHRRLLRRGDMSSVVVVPLQAGRRALGSLLLVGTAGRRFDRGDVELAVELGRRAGTAVDKARMYAERDLVARTLQRSLLPPVLPDVPGVELFAHYEPAFSTVGRGGGRLGDIGGDFYDVFETSPGRWWVALGDVCGKGPEAAALTGAIRWTLRAVATGASDPAVVLERLNAAVLRQDWDDRFSTVALLTFAAGGGERLPVRVATAGHPAPLLRSADGVRSLDDVRGSLLGVLPTLGARPLEVVLRRGDELLLFTDGATEVPLADGSRLDEAGLATLLARAPRGPRRLVEFLAASVAAAAAGRRDDLALLALSPR
jgi:serine phosphatase RsbU (regulator of sigma subunit)